MRSLGAFSSAGGLSQLLHRKRMLAANGRYARLVAPTYKRGVWRSNS